jgi:hypothetical protein
MVKIRSGGAALVATALLCGCVPRQAPPAPVPAPAPAPHSTSPPPQPPAPPPADWREGPLSPGDWTYRTGRALYGVDGAGPGFVMSCAAPGRISLAMALGSGEPAMTVRTSYGERTLPASAGSDGLVATLAASDPLLDQIAFSRGRFLVQAGAAAALVLPAWPETARVTEDCRAQ